MELTTTHDADRTRISLTGRFDAHEAVAFRDAVEGSIADGHHQIDVHLGAVEFVDSTALAEMVRAMKRTREHGGDLRIVEPSDPVRVILELTKLDLAFAIA